MDLREYTLFFSKRRLDCGEMVYFESRMISGSLQSSGIGEIYEIRPSYVSVRCPITYKSLAVITHREGTDYKYDVLIPLGWKYEST